MLAEEYELRDINGFRPHLEACVRREKPDEKGLRYREPVKVIALFGPWPAR